MNSHIDAWDLDSLMNDHPSVFVFIKLGKKIAI